ncbi:hypothetical protein PQI66_12330 [Corynebacterium sp. USCH3]|uniref:hypothetical protein n=1 Tax=Corynebacterium sp. USCH3 TaxID=3024840 RepID=UPI0030A6CD10
MDFTLECNLPIRPTSTTEEVQVGDTLRSISYAYYGNDVPDVELTSILPGDTFCGVDLCQPPEKVHEDLHRAGYSATLEVDSLELDDHHVSMFICEDAIATVTWLPSNAKFEEDRRNAGLL